MPDRGINFYLSIDSFGLQSVRKQLDTAIGLNWSVMPIGMADIIHYARSLEHDSIEINFGTLYKRATLAASCWVDIFMTILLLLKQINFQHIGDAQDLQILLEVR